MQRITLKTAIEALQAQEIPTVQIIERPKGYGLLIGPDILRSQREDELTFLTWDGAINYAHRHLSPHCEQGVLIQIPDPRRTP